MPFSSIAGMGFKPYSLSFRETAEKLTEAPPAADEARRVSEKIRKITTNGRDAATFSSGLFISLSRKQK